MQTWLHCICNAIYHKFYKINITYHVVKGNEYFCKQQGEDINGVGEFYATIVYYQSMPNMHKSNAKYAVSNAKYAAQLALCA